MKTYEGIRTARGTTVTVQEGPGKPARPLKMRFDLRRHSPTGFEWGYGGSGPAQLALALLADHFGDDGKAQVWYQPFKWRSIANIKGEHWALTTRDIDSIMKVLENEGRGA